MSRVAAILGRKLTALVAGVRSTQHVAAWLDGEEAPQHVRIRLRIALLAAAIIAEKDGEGAAQAWFQGRNPHLGGRSPARVLRESQPEEAAREVLAAARAFRAST